MRILVGHATMPSGNARGIFVWQHPYLEEILCHIKRPMRGVNVRLVWTATKNFPFVSRNPGRRCGRGRHGRPWPCEWDVGREPDRDERSEPPAATPPPDELNRWGHVNP